MIHQAHTPGCTHLEPGMYRASWTGSIVRFEYRDTEEWVHRDDDRGEIKGTTQDTSPCGRTLNIGKNAGYGD